VSQSLENKEKNKIYDVAIVGGGPASFAAAIYAIHGNLKVVFIEKEVPGGKLTKTQSVQNYPGFENIHGADLALKMFDHVTKLGAEFVFSKVIKVNSISANEKILDLENGKKIYSKYVIIATGMVEKVPPIDRIEEFLFKGVSYCAICDGGLYKEKEVAVIGGGDAAVEESIYLSSVASKVHLFVRRDVFRANQHAVDQIKKIDKIVIHPNTTISKLLGTTVLNGINTINVKTKKEEKYPNVVGLFPYIGTLPKTHCIDHLKLVDHEGFVIVDKKMQTKEPGIYAAGDVIQKSIRQISTAVNDGTIAAKSIINQNAESK
jgi:thioredoxin reductase (NADPH)